MQDGSTPLHYAAAFGQSAVVEALVRAGCPVDVRDNASNTPLHLAAGMMLQLQKSDIWRGSLLSGWHFGLRS